LLPGIMRAFLIENSNCVVQEKPLTRDDVQKAEAIFLCNSVRGVVRVRLRM